MCVAIESLLRGNGPEVFGRDFFNTIDPKRTFLDAAYLAKPAP
jgi:hypothetical protein